MAQPLSADGLSYGRLLSLGGGWERYVSAAPSNNCTDLIAWTCESGVGQGTALATAPGTTAGTTAGKDSDTAIGAAL